MLSTVTSLLGSSTFADEDPILTQYAASLSGSAPAELKAIERLCRSLNLYTNLNDTDGQVQACDALCEMNHTPNGSLFLARAVMDQGTLPSLVVVLHGGKPEPCRAAAALLAEICGRASEQRKAVVRSGALKPLVSLLRHSDEPRLLREGARVLAALADEPTAVSSLLRESAPRALKHLCRSRAVQSHALAVRALGRLARGDENLLASAGLPRVFCSVASSSVLEARSAAAHEMRLLLQLPSRRPAMLGAGAVKVLLRCCDVLNEDLKLASLHALSLLLTGATMPTEAASSASPSAAASEAAAAEEARMHAASQLSELGGPAVLVNLADDPKPLVSCRALQLVEFLGREAIYHPALEQAKVVQLLVALSKGETLRPPPSEGDLTARSSGAASVSTGLQRDPASPTRNKSRWSSDSSGGGGAPRALFEEVAREGKQTIDKIGKALTDFTDKTKSRLGRGGSSALALSGSPRSRMPTMPQAWAPAGGELALSGSAEGGTLTAAGVSARPFPEHGAPATSEPPPLLPTASRLLIARSIANMLASSTAQLALVAAGGLPALLAMAGGGRGASSAPTALDGKADVRREVVRALARLCQSSLHAPALYREGALNVLLALLETAQRDNDERSLRHAACALGALTALPEVQIEVSRLKAVPSLVKLARSRVATRDRLSFSSSSCRPLPTSHLSQSSTVR